MQRRFSIIVVSRSEESADDCLNALAALNYPSEQIEVFLSCGTNPSAQRNEAAELATGEFLLFLDNDSVPDADLLRQYDDALAKNTGIGIIGGPSIYRSEKSRFGAILLSFFSSSFGLGPFRARYASLGKLRRANERDLILCNMLVRRDLFLSSHGFNPDLFPNEENEFLNRMSRKTKIYYHPFAICYRFPRANLIEFLNQMMRYGAGRAKSLVMFPEFLTYIFFLPVLLLIYLLALPVLIILFPASLITVLFPLFIYFSITFFIALCSIFNNGELFTIVYLPPLFLLAHVFYGIGLVAGALSYPWRQHATPIQVQWLHKKIFDSAW